MKNISFRNDVLPLKNVLYRLALRITLNREEAEDVVQDTLIKVWNRRDDWQDIDSIEAFSLTICRNLSLDRMKKAGNDNRPIGMQLRDFEGKSYKEIAEVLGISEEQVKINIFRARQAVKQKYNEIDRYGL